MGFPYNITNDSVTVVVDGRPTTVAKSAANFLPLREALLEGRWDDVRSYLSAGAGLAAWAQGLFTVSGNTVRFQGQDLPHDLNSRIVEMAAAGESPEPLFRFWERLTLNPSRRSVEQLWRFLSLTGIPLTGDGHFLGYKGVRPDFKDCYTGTVDNSPGQLVQVPRNSVSDDPQTPCHFGLHVGSLEYATSFGQRVVIVKVDPQHVVCVPYDCTSQKMRVCQYVVVGLHGEGHMPSTTIADSDWDPESSDWDDFFDDDATVDHDDGRNDLLVDEIDTGLHAAVPKDDIPRPKRRNPKWIRELDAKTAAELHEVPMDVLRRYAAKGLRIVGASRIKGGKRGLIEAIVRVDPR